MTADEKDKEKEKEEDNDQRAIGVNYIACALRSKHHRRNQSAVSLSRI